MNQVDNDLVSWVPNYLIQTRLDCTYNSPKAVEARRVISKYKNVMSLKEITEKITCGPFGSTLTADEHDPDGDVTLLQPTDISGWECTFKPGWYINSQTLIDKNLPLYSAFSLLFARVGNPYCCVLPKRVGKATISSSMIAAKLDNEVVDPYYIQSFFQSDLGLTLLYSIQKTVAQPTLSTKELSELPIPIPELAIQKALGNQLRKAERLKELAYIMNSSKHIRSLLDNTFPVEQFLSASEDIDQWLKDNSSPHTDGGIEL